VRISTFWSITSLSHVKRPDIICNFGFSNNTETLEKEMMRVHASVRQRARSGRRSKTKQYLEYPHVAQHNKHTTNTQHTQKMAHTHATHLNVCTTTHTQQSHIIRTTDHTHTTHSHGNTFECAHHNTIKRMYTHTNTIKTCSLS